MFSIPADTRRIIYQLLPADTLFACRKVSRTWKQDIDNQQEIWKRVYHDRYGSPQVDCMSWYRCMRTECLVRYNLKNRFYVESQRALPFPFDGREVRLGNYLYYPKEAELIQYDLKRDITKKIPILLITEDWICGLKTIGNNRLLIKCAYGFIGVWDSQTHAVAFRKYNFFIEAKIIGENLLAFINREKLLEVWNIEADQSLAKVKIPNIISYGIHAGYIFWRTAMTLVCYAIDQKHIQWEYTNGEIFDEFVLCDDYVIVTFNRKPCNTFLSLSGKVLNNELIKSFANHKVEHLGEYLLFHTTSETVLGLFRNGKWNQKIHLEKSYSQLQYACQHGEYIFSVESLLNNQFKIHLFKPESKNEKTRTLWCGSNDYASVPKIMAAGDLACVIHGSKVEIFSLKSGESLLNLLVEMGHYFFYGQGILEYHRKEDAYAVRHMSFVVENHPANQNSIFDQWGSYFFRLIGRTGTS